MKDMLSTDVRYLKGIGEKRAQLLARLSIFNALDLISYYPRVYVDKTKTVKISETLNEQLCCIIGEITTPVFEHRIRGSLLLYKFTVSDGENAMEVILFNQKYLAKSLKQGEKYLFYGKIKRNFLKSEMTGPVIEKLKDGEETGRIEAIYPLCAGLTQNVIRKAVKSGLSQYIESLPEILPESIRKQYGLLSQKDATVKIHFPLNQKDITDARRTLGFTELLLLQIGLLKLKERNRGTTENIIKNTDISDFITSLPYSLTNSQKNAINDCLADMKNDRPMNRLVQGDVGCGKTVVAAALIFASYKNRFQSVMMAPTEILARQHFETLSSLLSSLGVKIECLVGSMSSKEKERVINSVKNGECDLLVGTHAVIEDRVIFPNLALVIVDEQHRFGVAQRAKLCSKGKNPHTLIMSATPIPRTLGLIMYGDLDVSSITEMPPGRKPVKTYLVDNDMHTRIYNFARKEVLSGNRVYIVCPLIEGEEGEELHDVLNFSKEIKKEFFPDIPLAVIHGKMKAAEKDSVMKDFYEGKTSVLVSTTVIEVGVDVKEATLMMIENAERFGLSQLHQLRGRVGRGDKKSYCILVSDAKTGVTKQRLSVMTETNDGFKISETDMKLRGPGDFFGDRQHGLPDLKIASIFSDTEMLSDSQKLAKTIMKTDPELKSKEFYELYLATKRFFSEYGTFN